jgi:hypothetical protein
MDRSSQSCSTAHEVLAKAGRGNIGFEYISTITCIQFMLLKIKHIHNNGSLLNVIHTPRPAQGCRRPQVEHQEREIAL